MSQRGGCRPCRRFRLPRLFLSTVPVAQGGEGPSPHPRHAPGPQPCDHLGKGSQAGGGDVGPTVCNREDCALGADPQGPSQTHPFPRGPRL